MQSHMITDEYYCIPWDLKIQEDKLKLLNEQQQQILSLNTIRKLPNTYIHPSTIKDQSLSLNHNNTNNLFHQTYVRHTLSSSTKKSSTHRDLTPPILPPLPPGGLIPLCQYIRNNNNSIIENLDPCTIIHSNTDNLHNSLFSSKSSSNKHIEKSNMDNTQSISCKTGLFHCKHLNSSFQNNSLSKIPITYEQPWDRLQTSCNNNYYKESLQKIQNKEEIKKQHISIPIDHYFWFHHGISRRHAENILQFRPFGSFLVRQSESGNQNDYSLSIKTTNGCMHMRICYSGGYYILGECSRPFMSVSSMIKYFSQTFVPIRGAAHIKLGTPVLRCEILSSSLSNEEL